MSGPAAAMMLGAAGPPGIFNGALPNGAKTGANPSWQLNNDGTYTIDTGQSGNWITPNTATLAAYYQAKTDVTSGAFSVDPSAGSYIDCSTTRTWTRNGIGTTQFNVTFREKATGVVRSTQTGLTLTRV